MGCTKEVSLQLKSSTPRLVIEGVVSNGVMGSYVRLSWSQQLNKQADYLEEPDAFVVLTDSSRQLSDTLRPARDNQQHYFYPSYIIKAIPGHVYHLNVLLQGKSYTARSVMADTTTFDGISLLSSAGKLTKESIITVVPKYVDPGEVKNYYRFEQYINGRKDPGICMLNDNVGDGLVNERPIFTKEIDIHPGDTLTVVMIQLSAPVYRYFYQLSQNQEALGSTPSNPISNVEGGALGEFSAEDRQYYNWVLLDD